MPDQATLNHAAQVLASISADRRADLALRAYFEAHRYLQPPAKRGISQAVFVYFRWLSWLDPKSPAQTRLAQALTLQERFNADAKSIKAETLAARAVPGWLASEMVLTPDYLRYLQRDPALWLRARPGTADALAKSLFACERTKLAPDALRFTGTQDLFRTAQFAAGEFEIQDLASQLVGMACAPQPGETWWDVCAGEGGKTLHLADQMANKGVVWATDRNAKRLETLKRRAGRAKLFNYRAALWDGPVLGSSHGTPKLPTKAKFDGILVDAPCSGVGTWQRNPHARWATTPNDVRELAATQLALLNTVAGSLKPGGRLIYSVCTLTRSETTAVVEAFSAAHPELEPVPVLGEVRDQKPEISAPPAASLTSDLPFVVPQSRTKEGLSPVTPSLPPLTSDFSPLTSSVFLWPHVINANGMFIAAWQIKT